MSSKKTDFSVSLGLFDYINPILYSITIFKIITNMFGIMLFPYNFLILIGAIISLIFGFTIPTVKLLVGLGKLKFKMPVNLVFYVNLGIFLSGISFFKTIFDINTLIFLISIIAILLLLGFIYYKTKKFNTIAVLIGSAGYIFLYASLIHLSLTYNMILPVILYVFAICLFIFLCLVGIFANLKDAKVHWIIETFNVLCQLLVMLGTIILL